MKKIFKAYKSFWLNGFDFSGYSTRFEYWTPVIINTIIGLILGMSFYPTNMHFNDLNFESILMYITLLVFAIPTLAVQVRRLHDINRTSTLVIISVILNLTIMLLNDQGLLSNILDILQFVVSIWIFIYMFFKSKTHVEPEKRKHF